jgi:hypothetical protein
MRMCKKGTTMSEIRAVAGSSEYRSQPKPRENPKRDGSDGRDLRRVRKPQEIDAETTEDETHKLNVSA